ncbi:MAG: ABC transporter substrate-binding protein, partial [Nocardioides sp.]
MAVLVLTGLGLTACGGDDDAGGGEVSGKAPGAGRAECKQLEQFGDLTGETVAVYTSIVDVEGDTQKASYKVFEDCTGAKVEYEGSREFEAQLLVRIQGGNQPDIAYIPQPGLLKTVVQDTGAVVEPPQSVADNVDEFFGEDWKGYGTVDDTFYAAPLGANVKSLVWYSPKTFTDNGYEIPETWDELLALSDKMAADGVKPWCAGIGSGDATGWPTTDWLEDV